MIITTDFEERILSVVNRLKEIEKIPNHNIGSNVTSYSFDEEGVTINSYSTMPYGGCDELSWSILWSSLNEPDIYFENIIAQQEDQRRAALLHQAERRKSEEERIEKSTYERLRNKYESD